MNYNIIRSRRRTMALEISRDGQVIVRAPQLASKNKIDEFVLQHADWIEKNLKKTEARRAELEHVEPLTEVEIKELVKLARRVIPERVAYYAPLVGVSYGRISIRHQRSKWGSCSSKGNLNFNCLLMLAPPEVLDSVVVHELCHRKEMNHSKRFYSEVLRVMPDYKERHKWLKENGDALMARIR